MAKPGSAIIADPLRGTAGQRYGVQVSVVGGNKNRPAVGTQYVVVVDRRHTAEIDLLGVAPIDGDPIQIAATIDDQPVAGPVGRLEQQAGRAVDEPSLTGGHI